MSSQFIDKNHELEIINYELIMKKQGFTLVEVLIAIILVGIAIAALVGANISFTQANGSGTDLSTAEFLIEQIRERTTLFDYTNLLSFNNPNFVSPINANGEVLTDFAVAGFTEQITVKYVSNANFQTVVAPPGTSDFVKINVEIRLHGKTISSACWIRANLPK